MDELLNIIAYGDVNFEEVEDALLLNIATPPTGIRQIRSLEYGRLNLEKMPEDRVMLEFRFKKQDLARLSTALRIPQVIRTSRRHTASGVEALCICLRRLVYPNRLYDLEKLFGLSAQSLSNICNLIITHIYDNYNHLLLDLRSNRWLNYDRLRLYSRCIENRNAPLYNCWGFIDGTARAICRPSVMQQEYFSGHKRQHCVKYQSVLCPDGIVINLSEAYPGRRHDAGILRESNLYNQLETCCKFQNGDSFTLYGDPAYGVQELILSPFRNRVLSEGQQQFNIRMSFVRQAVEWGFGKVISQFAFLDYKKKQKLLLQDVSKMYAVATLLTNCHTCLYSSQASQYFGIAPPTIEQYLDIPM